jgi:hypothetical protein
MTKIAASLAPVSVERFSVDARLIPADANKQTQFAATTGRPKILIMGDPLLRTRR